MAAAAACDRHPLRPPRVTQLHRQPAIQQHSAAAWRSGTQAHKPAAWMLAASDIYSHAASNAQCQSEAPTPPPPFGGRTAWPQAWTCANLQGAGDCRVGVVQQQAEGRLVERPSEQLKAPQILLPPSSSRAHRHSQQEMSSCSVGQLTASATTHAAVGAEAEEVWYGVEAHPK